MVSNDKRRCTDILCLILFILALFAFIGLLIYGVISGTPLDVVSVYNSNQVKCRSNPNFKCTTSLIKMASSPISARDSMRSASINVQQLPTLHLPVLLIASPVLADHSLLRIPLRLYWVSAYRMSAPMASLYPRY